MVKISLGFHKGVSTEDCIHEVIKGINKLKEYDKNNFVLAISLDIKGAFDYLEWSSIIYAIEKKNSPKYIVDIIKSYLSNRKISIGNAAKSLTRGCPQGGVLSAPV